MDKAEAPDPEIPDDAAERAKTRASPRRAAYSSPVCYAADFPEYFGVDPETDAGDPGPSADDPGAIPEEPR